MIDPMRTTLALVGTLATFALAPTVDAAPKKYHYELVTVSPKADIKPELAKVVVPRIEGQVKKAFETHPQLVANFDGAPDPKTKADAYRAFMAKKGVTGAYTVRVDVTEATEELVPVEGKPNTQRLVVHVELHMLGEQIPAMTMGFAGDGHATIKQEIGMKVRDRDREFAWDECAKLAVDDAIKESLKQLAAPPKKK
jgi:hypothetical protein